MSFLSKDVGIDLGTANTLVYITKCTRSTTACFLYKKLVFSPSGTCQHGVFSIYAIIAQLDGALASDNCDMAGFRLIFV